MIKDIKCDTYIQRLYCDKCNKEMKATDVFRHVNPPQYKHLCECSPEEPVVLNVGYPHFTFKDCVTEGFEHPNYEERSAEV
jgi:hypothetical protein